MKFKNVVKAFSVGCCIGAEIACDQMVGSVGVTMVASGILKKDKTSIFYGTLFTAIGLKNYISKIIRYSNGDNLGYDRLILGKDFDEWAAEIE